MLGDIRPDGGTTITLAAPLPPLEERRMSIRVMLADDHKILREALRSVLEHEPDIEVVAEAADGREAVEVAKSATPDLIVMDIGMPGLDGIEATRRILAGNPAIKVVALSTYSDKRIAQQMMEAGAKGYVVKAAGGDELLTAIRSVMGGDLYLSPEIAANMADGLRGKVRQGPPDLIVAEDRRLSKRERDVLQLLIDARSNTEIGEQLHIAPSTVEAHRVNIMRKLDLHSPAELATYAIIHGLRSA